MKHMGIWLVGHGACSTFSVLATVKVKSYSNNTTNTLGKEEREVAEISLRKLFKLAFEGNCSFLLKRVC